jgi:tetrahydromethanopterin S-methyltransferase subunit D
MLCRLTAFASSSTAGSVSSTFVQGLSGGSLGGGGGAEVREVLIYSFLSSFLPSSFAQ